MIMAGTQKLAPFLNKIHVSKSLRQTSYIKRIYLFKFFFFWVSNRTARDFKQQAHKVSQISSYIGTRQIKNNDLSTSYKSNKLATM